MNDRVRKAYHPITVLALPDEDVLLALYKRLRARTPEQLGEAIEAAATAMEKDEARVSMGRLIQAHMVCFVAWFPEHVFTPALTDAIKRLEAGGE